MLKEESELFVFSGDAFLYTSLSQIKNSKKRNIEVKNLSDEIGQNKIFQRILLNIYQKEQKILSFLKRKEESDSKSLGVFLSLLREYNCALIALKRFEDDVFIIDVLKKTNSVYRPAFSDFVLRMRKRVLEKRKNKLVQLDLTELYDLQGETFDLEEDEYFAKDVKDQKKLFELNKNVPMPFLMPCEDAGEYTRVCDESGIFYEEKYPDRMYQMFLDIVDQKTIKLIRNKEFCWENIQLDRMDLSVFFADLFKSLLRKRKSILREGNKLFEEEKKLKKELERNKTKLLRLFLPEERERFISEWSFFEKAVCLNDLKKIDNGWKTLQKCSVLNQEKEYLYVCYFESLLKNILFVPGLVERKIPDKPEEFLSVLNDVLFFEKRHLKKLLKFALKTCLFEMMPVITFSILKTGLKEMQKIIQTEIETIQDNLLLLHLFAVKKSKLHSQVKNIVYQQNEYQSIDEIDYKGHTALIVAVCEKNIEKVKKLLLSECNIDLSDYMGQTALMKAAQNGDAEILSLLLLKGADPLKMDFKHKTAYHFAIENKNIECLKNLIEKETEIKTLFLNGETLLHLSLQADDIDSFRFLLKKGSDPYLLNEKGKSVIDLLSKKGNDFKKALADHQKQQKEFEFLLLQGILSNNKDFVLKAVEKKAHLTEIYLYQQTPLEIALEVACKEIVLLLVKNKCFGVQKKRKNLGYLSLLYAMVELDEEYFKILLQAGADVDGTDMENQETLLHKAVLFNYMPFVKILVENGADFNKKDSEGKTPIDLAKHYGYTEIENFLKMSSR